ncbi:hypothetical protein [Streptomyces eurythermus]|uniref:hypothetical protein n=1 Tax=Streptomyces eurythermus TaxID=42237 RepID=UPI0036F954A8
MTLSAPNLASTSLASREFLLHHDRLLRPELCEWARRLNRELDGLNAAQAAQPEEFSNISSCMNKASFVLASAGHLEMSLRMCQSQLGWVAQRFEACSDLRILGHAIQPWINIGRLYAIRGNLQGALPYFRLAAHLAEPKSATLGPCYLSAEAWMVIRRDSSLPGVLWNVYTYETLKGYLKIQDFPGVKAAILEMRRVVPAEFHGFIAEGEILGLLHQGNAEEAVRRAARAVAASAFDEAAYGLHEVTGLIMLGRTKEALRRTMSFLPFLACVEPQRPKDVPTILRQLKQMSLLMEALGEVKYSVAAVLRGLDICADYADEPLRFNFLAAALRLAPAHPDTPNWAREHAALSAHSLYAEVRRRCGAKQELPDPSPLLGLLRAVEGAALGTPPRSSALHP